MHCSDEHWRDQCGVFGVHAPGEDVARMGFFGLFALQHRGQESAGIAVARGTEVVAHRGMGLAFAVFDEDTLAELSGDIALAHVRYSTTGSNVINNAQPMLGEHRSGPFAVAHNGNLTNYSALRDELAAEGVEFRATSDTEIIVHLIARSQAATLEEAVVEAMQHMRGAYSIGVIGPGKLIGARDPHGVRPLSIGRLNGGAQYVISSEDCAYHVVGAQYMREVEPGEVVVIDEQGLRELRAVEMQRKAVCVFEFIYFARPDSHIYGKSIYNVRQGMGRLLAQQSPTDADIVVGVPESAIPHAIGYSQVAKIPYQEGFIKNRYIFRTFIHPDQRLRELGVRMKLAPLRETLAGRRVIVVDDSIVRGTTTRQEIALMRDAGAREVHMRVCSPPIRYPCFYGVDTSAGRKELIAARLEVEDIRQHIGADSLEYLTLDNLVAATGLSKRHFCTACFDGRYPIRVPADVKVSKFDLEPQKAPVAAE
ncbi:MAG: amidophosphoribosyltransferase [Armatimonadetes bacterium]|nr:amidophosphoribosyltransferase [Armatimonadota bacterium]